MAVFETKSGKAAVYAERSEKDGAVNIGVKSEPASGFVSLAADKRALAHLASVACAAVALRRRSGGTRAVERARKDARKRARGLWTARKNPRVSTGLSPKTLHRLLKRKKRGKSTREKSFIKR